MKQATLTRVISGPDGTFGAFVFEGRPLCVTCENPWKNNKRVISCIPDGKYRVKKFSGPRFKDVWEITNVPNRTAILIHAANLEVEVDGCVAAGGSFALFNGVQGVANSARTIGMLRTVLPDEFDLVVTGLNFVLK